MKRFYWYLGLIIVFPVVCMMSCAEESEIGYGLVQDGELDVSYSEDIKVITETTKVDSLEGYTSTFFVGNVTDPDFGQISSEVYMNTNISEGFIPDFGGGTYDSLVLLLSLSPERFVGSQDELFDIEVYELLEVLPESISSDQKFSYGDLIGLKEDISISTLDSARIPLTDTTTRAFTDAIAISLSSAIGRRLFSDTTAYTSDEAFRELLAGIHIKSKATENLLALNLNSFGTIYYYDNDDVYRTYTFNFGDLQFSNYNRDYTGSTVEDLFARPTTPEERIYTQGLAGPVVKIDLSDIKNLGDVIINHAVIEFAMEVDPAKRDTSLYPLAEQLTLSKIEDGRLVPIDDLELGSFFGGMAEFDVRNLLFRVEMNVSSHLSGVVDGKEPEDIYLRTTDAIRNPAGAILYGPEHPEFPIKLKVTYTEL